MKKINLLLSASLITINSFSQQAPTGFGTNGVGANAATFWARGGNLPNGAGNNIFGTMWNSPIYTKTAGFTRTRLNGDLTTLIQNVNQNVSGYMGLSFNPGAASVFDVESPRSMLHIDGPNNTPFSGDWRRWMRTGTYYRENSDAMYVGMKDEFTATGVNRSDAVVNWSDDAGTAGGPDALRFIFTSTSDGNGAGSTNPRQSSSLNGYEYMRMMPYPYNPNLINSTGTSVGHIGIGPLFDNTAANSPKSRLHLSSEDKLENYIQVGNELVTGIQHNDGLRMGIHNDKNYPANNLSNGHAYIYNQENRSILFSTNHVAPSVQGGADVVTDFERVRISSNTTPTFINNGTSFGNYNPGALPNDLTRVSISHDPTKPLNNPLALLHLGYNTGFAFFPNAVGGWRPWMDVGTLVTNATDHVFVGLKPESIGPSSINRQDAVIAWGDDYNSPAGPGTISGPDKLRIIFTSPKPGDPFSGPGAMNTPDGLEFVRYVPFNNTSLGVNDPRTGFGDFQNLAPVGTIDPGNTVEINSIMNGFNAPANPAVTGSYPGSTGASGLRFRDLTRNSLVAANPNPDIDFSKVLSVDTYGNVVLIGSNGNSFGGPCSAPIPSTNLSSDWRVGMNNHSVNFIGYGNVNIGDLNSCLPGSTSQARLWIRNSFGSPNPTTGLRVDNNNITGAYAAYFASGDVGMTQNAYVNGATLVTSDKNVKTNIVSVKNSFEVINKLRPVSYNYNNNYAPQMIFDAGTHYGFIAQEVEQILPQLVKQHAVFGRLDSLGNTIDSTVMVKALNYDGLIPFAIGGIQELNAKQKEMQANIDKLNLSDAQVKTNINTFNALATVKTLSPVKYNFTNTNVPQLSFKPNTDYGFIAQQLETVYPELVDTIRVEATYDSVGVVVNPSKVLKTVNYKAMSALLVRSIQEQQLTIDSLRNAHSKQDSINNAVQQQLAALASQINSCCSNTTTSRQSNSTLNQLDIELSDKDAIVLNQNVPNPFAEQTTITYNVPASVNKAQIIFYNSAGQIIQTIDVKTRGKGKVNVFASDLSSGLYHYTLVADGKVVDSKKMVRE